MTRKADPIVQPEAPPPTIDAPIIDAPTFDPLPTHPLPTEGGCWIVIDGVLRVDTTPTPDPEV